MRYFFDTEFIERPDIQRLIPISIGVVCEDGREFYAIDASHDSVLACEWVKAHVLAKLPSREKRPDLWLEPDRLAARLLAFIREGERAPEFWAYFADYDWVVFCWMLRRRMIELPKGFPYLCFDLMQSICERGMEKDVLPPRDPAKVHDALEDARWLKRAYVAVFRGRG